MNETISALLELARLVGAGIVGGLIAVFAGHRLTLSRERAKLKYDEQTAKKARRRQFTSVLDGLKAETMRSHPRELATVFRDRVYEVRREEAMIRGDIASDKQAGFAERIDTLCNVSDAQVGAAGGRQRITDAIDAIKAFVDAS
jgi:hypothetical protein